MRARGEGGELVHELLRPEAVLREVNVPALNGGGDGVHTGDLAAFRCEADDPDELFPQRLDDGAAVGLVLDQDVSGIREQSPNCADGFHRTRKIQMLVDAVAKVVVDAPLAPDLDGDEIVILTSFECGVHADDGGPEGLDLLRVVVPPPLAPDEIAAFHPGRALEKRLPGSQAALFRVVQVALLKLPEPFIILADLRYKGIADLPSKEVMLLCLHRQPDQPNVVLPLEDTSRQVVLVPRGHNEDDFRPGSETGLQCVLPLAPQLFPVDGAVRLFPVFNGVVDDEQIRRVSRDAGHDAPGDHAPPAVCQFKLGLRPDAARFQAKKGAAELLHLLQVLPPEPFGRVVVIAGLDDPVFGIPPQIPAGKALRDGN